MSDPPSPPSGYYTTRGRLRPNLDIYSMKPDGTDLINLTNNAAEDGAPNWGPR